MAERAGGAAQTSGLGDVVGGGVAEPPRLWRSDRAQVLLEPVCLEPRLAADHPARAVWAAAQVDRLSQDSPRMWAAAGTSSFRRAKTLRHLLDEARAHVEAVKPQADEALGQAARQTAAQERAARNQRRVGSRRVRRGHQSGHRDECAIE
jgi:hypothetical protein